MMTDDQLAAIEARAEAYDPNDYPQPIMAYDIPALVAEVQRLRGQVDALADLVEWTQDHYAYKHPSWDLSLAKEKLTAILNGAESEGA